MLDRRDVHDDAGALPEHRRQQCTIEADGGHQVQIQLLRPRLVVERGESAGRGVRPAEHIHEDVDPAEAAEEALRDGRAARSRRNVRGNVVHASVCVSGNLACRRDDCRTSVVQHIDDGRADALRAGGDEQAHGAISSRAILSPSRVKRARCGDCQQGRSRPRRHADC